MWPAQTFSSIIALTPKSVECDRPICKCPTVHRIYCKARNHHLDDWTAERQIFWDTAMRGASALQAALLRGVGHEVARSQGMCSVGGPLGP
eukprot:7537573-Pyramimonas_sp.AAC.1